MLLNLFEPEEALYEVHVRFVNSTIFAEGAFTFLGLFGKNVTFKRLLVGNLSRAGYFEPLFCARVSFNFWHYLVINFYTLLAFRTGGLLWSLVGNHPPLARRTKRAAKLSKKNEISSCSG
jgi:hypothetical protein